MSSSTWESEAARFLALDGHGKQTWLANLLFALTVFARDTYTVGGDSLDDPQRMRRFNELSHRTATQLRNHISGTPGLPDETFAQMVGEEMGVLGFSKEDLMKLMG